jgi:hypothetical protein
MKSYKFIIIGMMMFFTSALQAQIHVNINFGTPPLWGPVGYSEAQYYYLPDVESYYDVRASMFIYLSGGVWIHRSYLPARYRNYDLYGGYKVVMSDYHGNRPYSNFNSYRRMYGRGYHGPEQRNIGVRPGRGIANENRSRNGHFGDMNRHDNGRNEGHGRGNNMKENNDRGNNGNGRGNNMKENKGRGNNGNGRGNGKGNK